MERIVPFKSFQSLSSKQVALLLGYLDHEDRISLEKLIGKGVTKRNPLLDPLKMNGTKWTPLMNHKEA